MKHRNAFTLIEMLARPGVASKHEKRSQSRSAFTLIEMLVVIAIIALLAGIIVPTVSKTLDRAKRIKCMNNLKELSSGLMQYRLNEATLKNPEPLDKTKPSGQWSWVFRLQEAGVISGYTSVGGIIENNKMFHCPEDEGPGNNRPSFALNSFVSASGGPFKQYQNVSSIPNPARTILLAEVWGRRDDKGYTKVDPNSAFAAFERHDGSANYAFVDGRVETINYSQITTPDQTEWLDLWRPDL